MVELAELVACPLVGTVVVEVEDGASEFTVSHDGGRQVERFAPLYEPYSVVMLLTVVRVYQQGRKLTERESREAVGVLGDVRSRASQFTTP